MTQLKSEIAKRGVRIIDLGIGSPDMPPASHVQTAFQNALKDPRVFGYATTEGTEEFRSAAANFLESRYGAKVDPDTEVLTVMGAQDALSHISVAVVDPGDVILIPDPCYPIYEVTALLVGAIPYRMPLRKENNFLPDFSAIPSDILHKAKLMILNYPSNPVTAVATHSFFAEVVEFAKQHEILVLHDAAYIELTFDGRTSPSFLATPGAKEVGIELHSLSKTFNFAGPRLAFAAGNREILSALRIVKSNIDYGVFRATQLAGTVALKEHPETHITHVRKLYQARRDAFLQPLQEAGWEIEPSLATMFIWLKTPNHMKSREFSRQLLEKTGVACVPGVGFGPEGEYYVRFALVQSEQILQEAAKLIAAAF
ncbi:LL-diaminopimelate aminotransferase [Sulfoacidibacillus thermotolerans]|uniref:Aminotransferase n=2 Tax=Sulfoacidibacillus thermotolerans TaxID=1765684 RepID=A0A2U3DAI1_SULT2|nr:LL-diaminopimelate aminotransferase [Sulfoacidibacillus thermotolerans]